MTYRVGEFAALTGVTVRALQHYDRLGLLKPSRTESGHRVYRTGDELRVRHILALRAIGMSLHRIAELLDAPAVHLVEAFQVQRARLEQSRAGIEDAIRALQQVETASDSTERPHGAVIGARVESTRRGTTRRSGGRSRSP